MKSFSTGGNHINFLTQDEGSDRIAAALGTSLARLAEVKKSGTLNYYSSKSSRHAKNQRE